MTVSIVCIGNSLVGSDDTGPRVHRILARKSLPSGCAIIDGGLAGIDLLPRLESSTGVVFVDHVAEVAGEEGIVVLSEEALLSAEADRYDHAASIPFLVRALESLGKMPRLALVGCVGRPDAETIRKVADTSLRLAESLL